jgi:predicted O-methyltransferase YrrM
MMQLKAYYTYWRNRVDAHGIHSPFVFDFYNTVLEQADEVNDKAIQRLRNKLKRDDRIISVEDFGAGSKKIAGTTRKVSAIAKTSAIHRKYGKLLARIIERYHLSHVVELGTSLGIGSLYLSQNGSVKKLITVEGSPEIAKIAHQNLVDFGAKNCEILVGKFEDHLQKIPESIEKIDMVYVDGNHQYQATLDYFNFFVDHVHESAFLVFDDIYWSEGMQKAWQEICASPKINVSIDLFRMGIVCKRPGQAKQHFVLKY